MPSYTQRYIALCALLVAAAVAQRMVPSRGSEPAVRPDWSSLPRQVNGWKDEDVAVDKRVAEYLGADAMITRIYRKGSRSLAFSAVFGTQWRSLHSPAGCYPSQGWQTVRRFHTRIEAPENCPHPGPLNAEVLLVKRGERYKVVTYLYAHPGGTTASWVEQCLRVTRAGTRAGGIVFIVEGDCTLETFDEVRQAEAELIRGLYNGVVRVWYTGG